MSHFKNPQPSDLTDSLEPKIRPGDLVEVITPVEYSQPDREIGLVLGIDKLWDSAMVCIAGQHRSIAHYHLRKIG